MSIRRYDLCERDSGGRKIEIMTKQLDHHELVAGTFDKFEKWKIRRTLKETGQTFPNQLKNLPFFFYNVIFSN